MDLETIKELSGPEYIFLSGNIVNDAFLETKNYEIEKWKENSVFEPVQYVGQQAVSSRWVIMEKR